MTNNEFLILIQKIQEIMVSVATGGAMIQKVEENYKEIYFKLAGELKKRKIKNKNPYSSLWDFYNYWSEELPSYQSRRTYIRYLYKELDDEIRTLLVIDERTDIKKSDNNKLFSIKFDDLHEEIIIKCKSHFENKKYDEAVLNSLKLVETKIREKGGFSDSDIGKSLMEKAFSVDKGPFSISDDKGEVDGWKYLFRGIIQALKNPHSHRFVGLNNEIETFQILVFVSYLLNFIDRLQMKPEEYDDIPF